MAFKLTDEQINGLLGKGFISVEYADSLLNKSAAGQKKATTELADNSVEELKAVPLQTDMVADNSVEELKAVPLQTDMVADKVAGAYSEQTPMASQMTDPAPGSIGPPAPNPNDVRAGSQVQNVQVGGFNVDANAPQNATPRPEKTIDQYAMRDAPAAAAQRAQQVAVITAKSNSEKEAPGGTKAIPPKVVHSGGGGGSLLRKSEQMAFAQAREYGMVEGILQQRANSINEQDAKQKSDALQQGFAAQQAAYDQYQVNRQERYNESLAELQELKRKSDEIANTKIDPDAHWSKGLFGSNTTANKIVAGIGILLGGFGQGASRTGGNARATNAGLDALNNTIEKDIDAQKANLVNRTGQLKQRESLYARNLELYKDADLAELATSRQYWEKAAQQVAVITAKSNSEKVKVEGDKAMLGINAKIAGYDVKEQARTEQIADARATALAARNPDLIEEKTFLKDYQAGKYGQVPIAKAREMMKSGSQAAAATGAGAPDKQFVITVDPETGETLQTPITGTARTADDAKQLKTDGENVANLNETLNRIDALRTKHGGGWTSINPLGEDAKDKAEIESLAAQALLQMKSLTESGALDKGVQEVGAKVLGNPTAYGSGADAASKAFRDNVNKSYQNKIKSRGVQFSGQTQKIVEKKR